METGNSENIKRMKHDLANLMNRCMIVSKILGAKENPYAELVQDPISEMEEIIQHINQNWSDLKRELSLKKPN